MRSIKGAHNIHSGIRTIAMKKRRASGELRSAKVGRCRLHCLHRHASMHPTLLSIAGLRQKKDNLDARRVEFAQTLRALNSQFCE